MTQPSSIPVVAACIRDDPGLIEDWRRFSEDKRTSDGWAFEALKRWPLTRQKWKVWQPFPQDDSPRPSRYDDGEIACAAYILAELDYWATDRRQPWTTTVKSTSAIDIIGCREWG